MLRLDAALRGDLAKAMKQEKAAAATAVTSGIEDVTAGIVGDLRQQVLSAGLGKGVANAWQPKVFPIGKQSVNAVGWIKSKAPNIIYAFNYGAVIRSAKGLFLAIPTANAPKTGINGKRIHPGNFPGKLRFVYRSGKPSLLVVDTPGGRRGAAKSPASGAHGATTTVMFLLVPQVSLKKRLDIESVVAKWEPAVPERILADWPDAKE